LIAERLHGGACDPTLADGSGNCAADSLPRAGLAVRIVTLIAVVLPLAGLVAALVMLWGAPFHWVYLALFGGMYFLTALGIGVGFHRLFTHRSFETGAFFRFVWAALGSMAIEGPLVRWVAVHRRHHQHADIPGDPHSPHASSHDDHDHGAGVSGVLKGVWHSHIGWMFEPVAPDLDRYVPDLLKDPVVRFTNGTFVVWVALGLLVPAALGGILTGTWMGVLLGFLWGGLARVLLVHHVTWSINSVCHLWGTRPFKTRDESRDNPIFGVLALGEGWHNAHHAFPASAKHGLAWWKLDINYLVIRGMALLRLARNVRLPSAERIMERRRLRGA
jgi:stearoyl-CoA desaturase (delta-9 desaturase)